MNHCAALPLGRGNSIHRVRAPCSPVLLQPPSSQGFMWCNIARVKHCCPAQWYHVVVLPGRAALQDSPQSPHSITSWYTSIIRGQKWGHPHFLWLEGSSAIAQRARGGKAVCLALLLLEFSRSIVNSYSLL